MPLGGRWISRKTLALFRENAPALLREAEAPAAPRESFGFKATIPMGLSVGPKGRLVTSEIEDLPTHHRARAGRACQRQWRDCSQTDEVILLRESAQISVTAGGNDLFRLLTVPRWSIYDCQRRQFRLSGETGKPRGLPPCRHLPLKRSLRSLGKAFVRGSSHSCSLFPVPSFPRQIRISPPVLSHF